jgi:hypothetical protein
MASPIKEGPWDGATSRVWFDGRLSFASEMSQRLALRSKAMTVEMRIGRIARASMLSAGVGVGILDTNRGLLYRHR